MGEQMEGSSVAQESKAPSAQDTEGQVNLMAAEGRRVVESSEVAGEAKEEYTRHQIPGTKEVKKGDFEEARELPKSEEQFKKIPGREPEE